VQQTKLWAAFAHPKADSGGSELLAAYRVPYTHMGSPHWLGPWSVMQAKLHGGASTCAPYGLAWALLASASSGSASTAAKILFVVIGWFLVLVGSVAE
jgi:hypothetical protein